MKITEFESGQAGGVPSVSGKTGTRILPESFQKHLKGAQGATRPKTSREEAIDVAMKAVAEVPDTRDDAVAEIKAKIERGEYKVSGEDVAEMMIRRMRADNIR